MKIPIIIFSFFLGTFAFGQKKKVYNYVDSVIQYDNAEIIFYKGKIDTVWYNKQKWDITINKAEVVIIYEGKKLKHKK